MFILEKVWFREIEYLEVLYDFLILFKSDDFIILFMSNKIVLEWQEYLKNS